METTPMTPDDTFLAPPTTVPQTVDPDGYLTVLADALGDDDEHYADPLFAEAR